jgi:uncharacterized protein (DUF1778 family)
MAKKTDWLPNVRVTPCELWIIKAGAKKAGICMTDFIVGSALDRAAQVGVKRKIPSHPGQGFMF